MADETQQTDDAPTAEDWENACHAVIWTVDPALFDRIQAQVEVERTRPKILGPFPQPAWNPSIYPCGKCNHPVVDGFTCRTCGTGDPRTNKKGVRVYAD